MIARLAFALISSAPAAPASMTAPEAVAYLNQNRARLEIDHHLERRLTKWAVTALAGAVTAPSLTYAPEALADYVSRKLGQGPLFRGSAHLYGFTLVGAIGAALVAWSAYDLARLAPDAYRRAKRKAYYPRLRGLNAFLDLPEAEQSARLSEDPIGAARIVALAEFLRANPALSLSTHFGVQTP